MNIFRSLLGKVWQESNATEVVKLPTGQLYLTRPDTARASSECIFKEAMATIRRIPGIEHNFQLVITRVYEEGDQELLEDEAETDHERIFLIGEELQFRTGIRDEQPTLVWRDLEGDVEELYEFVIFESNEPTRALFETCMYRAMYERKYRRSADATQDADFEEFIWNPPAPKAKYNARRKISPKTEPHQTGTPRSRATEEGRSNAIKSPFLSSLESVLSHEATLYLWDAENEDFINQGIVTASIMKQKNAVYQYWLIASNDQGILLAHKISRDMNQRFSPKMTSLTWNYEGDDGSQRSWLFRFNDDKGVYDEFIQTFSSSLWETLNQSDWGKAKAEEQKYVLSADDDVEMLDVEDEEEEEDEVESELDPDEEPSEDEEEEDGEAPRLSGSDKNSQLTVGYKGDRSYVVRGNNIGVFSHTGGADVKYHATMSKLATPNGKELRPTHAMLHDQDTKMVLMNPSNPNSLFNLDIESGKIVEEWKVHNDISVDHIAPVSKSAPMTHEQTLVGVSHNALFRVDPRVSGTKLVESQFKQYVTKNRFSGVTTTDSGKLAVASAKGEIRMFDTIGKNAKTALPPLGDPIIGIDVTADGRHIVATTKTYLLLIDTLIGEGRYEGSLGFDRSFPATSKPVPRRLQLRSEHVAYMGGVSFTPARFNQGAGQEESAIVTSTGQFVIAWDFKKVKKGLVDKYEIKKYEDYVVQDSFKYGDDKNIIVALQNNVLAVNKKNLKKPTRHSLAPEASLSSRSHIVNSPY